MENLVGEDCTNMKSMFADDVVLKSVVFNKINTISVKDMSQMFVEDVELTSLDLSKFDTSNVENMEAMFADCEKLKTLTLSKNFKTSKVQSMSGM